MISIEYRISLPIVIPEQIYYQLHGQIEHSYWLRSLQSSTNLRPIFDRTIIQTSPTYIGSEYLNILYDKHSSNWIQHPYSIWNGSYYAKYIEHSILLKPPVFVCINLAWNDNQVTCYTFVNGSSFHRQRHGQMRFFSWLNLIWLVSEKWRHNPDRCLWKAHSINWLKYCPILPYITDWSLSEAIQVASVVSYYRKYPNHCYFHLCCIKRWIGTGKVFAKPRRIFKIHLHSLLQFQCTVFSR